MSENDINDFYVINSSHLDEEIEYILNNKIDSIELNSYINRFGYKINNINLIREKLGNQIIRLKVYTRDIDLNGINSFNKLEELHLMDGIKNANLQALNNLKVLRFSYDKGIVGLDSLLNIEDLLISNLNFLDKNLIHLKYLKQLELIKSKNLSFDKIISENSFLEKIELSYTNDVIDISQLLSVKNTLRELKIRNCKNIINMEKLSDLVNLERIVLSDCNEIKNSMFVDGLKKLTQLTVIGKSYFKDGNIDNLQRQGLTIGIDNKRHYSMKSNQFLNYFRNPPEPMP